MCLSTYGRKIMYPRRTCWQALWGAGHEQGKSCAWAGAWIYAVLPVNSFAGGTGKISILCHQKNWHQPAKQFTLYKFKIASNLTLVFNALQWESISLVALWLISHEIYPKFLYLIHMSHMPTWTHEILF